MFLFAEILDCWINLENLEIKMRKIEPPVLGHNISTSPYEYSSPYEYDKTLKKLFC